MANAIVNKDRLSKFISDNPSKWIEQAEKYESEKEWMDKSALIALKILRTLRSQTMTQKQLAENIGVTPQYVNKIVKGNENLSLETICKIEKALGISLVTVR
jgi:DNA-binding XRE family transcriptional regulator